MDTKWTAVDGFRQDGWTAVDGFVPKIFLETSGVLLYISVSPSNVIGKGVLGAMEFFPNLLKEKKAFDQSYGVGSGAAGRTAIGGTGGAPDKQETPVGSHGAPGEPELKKTTNDVVVGMMEELKIDGYTHPGPHVMLDWFPRSTSVGTGDSLAAAVAAAARRPPDEEFLAREQGDMRTFARKVWNPMGAAVLKSVYHTLRTRTVYCTSVPQKM